MRMHWAVLSVMVGVCGGACGMASGQILPPAPAKTPATPEYTPPPPPPTPPVTPKATAPAPAAPEEPLPTLVARDETEKLKPLGMPPEEAAIRALKPNEETMKKVESSLGARRDDLDRLVVEGVEALVELKKFSAVVTEKTSLDEITSNAKKALPFKTFPGVIDRLSREGAIDPQLKSRATKVAQEYQKALEAELLKGFEHSNTQVMVLVGFKRYMILSTMEAYSELDRLLASSSGQMEPLLDKIALPSEKKAAAATRTRGMPKAGGADAEAKRVEVLKGIFFDVLGPEERQAYLKAANPKLFEGKATGEKDGAATPPAGEKK